MNYGFIIEQVADKDCPFEVEPTTFNPSWQQDIDNRSVNQIVKQIESIRVLTSLESLNVANMENPSQQLKEVSIPLSANVFAAMYSSALIHQFRLSSIGNLNYFQGFMRIVAIGADSSRYAPIFSLLPPVFTKQQIEYSISHEAEHIRLAQGIDWFATCAIFTYFREGNVGVEKGIVSAPIRTINKVDLLFSKLLQINQAPGETNLSLRDREYIEFCNSVTSHGIDGLEIRKDAWQLALLKIKKKAYRDRRVLKAAPYLRETSKYFK